MEQAKDKSIYFFLFYKPSYPVPKMKQLTAFPRKKYLFSFSGRGMIASNTIPGTLCKYPVGSHLNSGKLFLNKFLEPQDYPSG
ncbi:hypothetical protein CEXT_301581 [Caerostris extrusa]|uniref:Uncharacterized protein n=1 Tax=Caerostris extrusa TaxID=172846 RepID=A0AAV4T273_CAEEX|nr:hypothetical protein CEXT_301581 [Caerostris extrusa]